MSKRLAKMDIRSAIHYEDASRYYWWHLLGGNGQIICSSETFKRRADAKRAMRRAIQIIQSRLFRIEE